MHLLFDKDQTQQSAYHTQSRNIRRELWHYFMLVLCVARSSDFLEQSLVFFPWSLILDPWSLILDPWSLILDPWSLIPDPDFLGNRTQCDTHCVVFELGEHGLLSSSKKLLWRRSVSQKGFRMGLDRLCCRCHKSCFHCGIDLQLWSAVTSVHGLLQRKQGKNR